MLSESRTSSSAAVACLQRLIGKCYSTLCRGWRGVQQSSLLIGLFEHIDALPEGLHGSWQDREIIFIGDFVLM